MNNIGIHMLFKSTHLYWAIYIFPMSIFPYANYIDIKISASSSELLEGGNERFHDHHYTVNLQCPAHSVQVAC